MNKFKFIVKLSSILLIVFFIVLSFFYLYLKLEKPKKNETMIFGVSFNPEYASSLGEEPRQVFDWLISDLGFKYVRFSAQWDEIEKQKGEYDFSDLDYYMARAVENNLKVILAVGRKTPRWPECHLPGWAKNQTFNQYSAELENYIKVVVERYKNNQALEIWQVENEAFLAFGECQPLKKDFLIKEINLVKSFDSNHPILISDTGELSLWFKTAMAGDLFGTTMYRTVWNKYIGYLNYDWLPISWYNFRLKIHGRDLSESYVVELQAEPWLPGTAVQNTSFEEQYKSMNFDRLIDNVEYAKNSGMSRSYLWGGEWWYYLLNNYKEADLVNYIKSLKKE